MVDKSAQNQEKFVLRMPDGMRDRIKSAAKLNNRSMNAEIIDTLEEHYPPISDDPLMEELHHLLAKSMSDIEKISKSELERLNVLIGQLAMVKDS